MSEVVAVVEYDINSFTLPRAEKCPKVSLWKKTKTWSSNARKALRQTYQCKFARIADFLIHAREMDEMDPKAIEVAVILVDVR